MLTRQSEWEERGHPDKKLGQDVNSVKIEVQKDANSKKLGANRD